MAEANPVADDSTRNRSSSHNIFADMEDQDSKED